LKQKTKRFLQLIIRFSISGLALYFVFNRTDLSAIKQLLGRTDPFLLACALVFFIISKVISAYRLNLFFQAVSIDIPAKINLRLYWLGMFYNLFLPGGIGGDGYKVYFLHRNMDAPVIKSVKALLFDRVTGLIALGVLCLLFGIFVPQQIVPDYYFMLSVGLGTALFYFIVYRWFSEFYRILNRTNVQSLGVQLAQIISAWLILNALGYDQLPVSYLLVFLISSVVAVIPFTIGGVGAREVTFLYAADILNLDLSVSIALSLLFFFITALVSLTGIWYAMRPELIRPKGPQPLNKNPDAVCS
jgi:glycosyltransferase 2 family protein